MEQSHLGKYRWPADPDLPAWESSVHLARRIKELGLDVDRIATTHGTGRTSRAELESAVSAVTDHR